MDNIPSELKNRINFSQLYVQFKQAYNEWLKKNPSMYGKEANFNITLRVTSRSNGLGYLGFTPDSKNQMQTLPYELANIYKVKLRVTPRVPNPADKPVNLPPEKTSFKNPTIPVVQNQTSEGATSAAKSPRGNPQTNPNLSSKGNMSSNSNPSITPPSKPNSTSSSTSNSSSNKQFINLVTTSKSKSGLKQCSNVNKPLDQIRDTTILSEDEQRIKDRCLKNPNDRSFDCIHWVSHQAARAMSTTKYCAGRITADKLMCIFRKEAGETYSSNVCRKDTKACGLAQMTDNKKGGAFVVLNGLNNYGLGHQYDLFWDLINEPKQKENKCNLTNRSALDRNTSIIMAATYMCTLIKEKPQRTDLELFCNYERSPQSCSKFRGGSSPYARIVQNCERNQTWKQVKHEMYIYKSSNCRKNPGSCPSNNISAFKSFAGSSINGGFAVK